MTVSLLGRRRVHGRHRLDGLRDLRALAMIGLATSLPHVALLLVGSAISDRLHRRLLMVASPLQLLGRAALLRDDHGRA
jgi:hypothetical protein